MGAVSEPAAERSASAIAVTLSVSAAHAQKKYDTGATDTEIKVGQTVPLSGPASAYATIGKTQSAYIKMINDRGGVNGRPIELLTRGAVTIRGRMPWASNATFLAEIALDRGGSFTLIDDYGHHPVEMAATLAAAVTVMAPLVPLTALFDESAILGLHPPAASTNGGVATPATHIAMVNSAIHLFIRIVLYGSDW